MLRVVVNPHCRDGGSIKKPQTEWFRAENVHLWTYHRLGKRQRNWLQKEKKPRIAAKQRRPKAIQIRLGVAVARPIRTTMIPSTSIQHFDLPTSLAITEDLFAGMLRPLSRIIMAIRVRVRPRANRHVPIVVQMKAGGS